MFYVADGKVYSTILDEKLRIYHEVSIVVDADGKVTATDMPTGTKVKPKNRQLCTMAEIVAQFGNEPDAMTYLNGTLGNSSEKQKTNFDAK